MKSEIKTIRKAVLPVAGLGTRFLPATKAVPKEMLTVVDRPVLQHVVDEARAAGIEHFIFVTGRNKGVIEDHFDSQFELEATLQARGKTKELEALGRDLPAAGQTSFTRQQAPLGLGHAVWCAREIVGDEPFALLLPDMLHHGQSPCLADMITAYAETGGNLIAVAPVPDDQTHRALRRHGGLAPVQGRDLRAARRCWCSPAGRRTPGWPPGRGPTRPCPTRSTRRALAEAVTEPRPPTPELSGMSTAALSWPQLLTALLGP